MISSRRLAREWALKILYQMDVGKGTLSDASESALDRLRMEFVQRGSRSASGSTAELVCLDYITSSLIDTLPAARPVFERAVLLCLDRAFAAAPYQQEILFEKSFKYKFKGVKLQPARLLSPVSEEPVFPLREQDATDSAALSETEKTRLTAFMSDMVITLPQLLVKEMRRTVRGQVVDLYNRRQATGMRWDAAAITELLQERRRNNDCAAEKWNRVAQMVQKQTADWLRVSAFTVKLLSLVDERLVEIDTRLTELSSGWKLDRQVAVDRNILRLAALEMLFLSDIPASASINEAVELAKKFSTAESGRFVNGVLGALAAQVGDKLRANESAAPLDEEIIDEIDLPGTLELEDEAFTAPGTDEGDEDDLDEENSA